MNIVITGAGGFVGTHLQRELATAPDTNIIAWELPSVDITKPDTYWPKLGELKPDWVVHLAAIASVGVAQEHEERTRAVNVGGTEKLFEGLAKHSPDTKVLLVSTSDIYGDEAKTFGSSPIPELDLSRAKPNNVYSKSKWEMEKMIEEKGYAAQCIRVRPFPHIGPGQGLGFVSADFASQIAEIEAGIQEGPLRVGNLEAARDFTDVRDVVRAYRLLIEGGELGEVYNIASGTPTKIQSLLDALLESSSASITVERDEARMRPSDTPILVGDASKLQAQTSWKPEIPLEQTLLEVLEYWRRQI